MNEICEGMDIPEVPTNSEPEPGYSEGQSKSDCKRVANDYYNWVNKWGKGRFCSQERKIKCGPDPFCNFMEEPECEDNIIDFM